MYEAIARNRRRAVLLMAGMTLLLGAAGFALAEVWQPGAGAFGVLAGLAVAAVSASLAWASGDRLLLASARARPVTHDEEPQLVNVVEEMAIASGLPMPRVCVVEDPAPNAFATGRSPATATVVVTRGCLDRLTREELQGVIGHEMGHVQNRDILFMTLAGALLGAVVILADVALRAAGFAGGSGGRRGGRSRRSDAGAVLLVGVVLAVVAVPLARLLYLAASCQREYLADATSALLTRYPAGLAVALEKIARSPTQLAANDAVAALCIVHPRPRSGDGTVSRFAGLFSTHPPTERRIAVLRAMGGGAGYAAYERAYAEVTGEQHVLPRSVRDWPPPQTPSAGARAEGRA